MREILFRGIISEETIIEDCTKEHFVYGLLYGLSRDCMINEDGLIFPIIPETVGQYTGLTDKNGVKIFEGDKTQYGFVEFCNGSWTINGDRLLSVFTDIEVIDELEQ